MPKKKWAVATAALAVVKGKKLSTNSNKAKSKKNNQYCDSSEESSDRSYSSGKEQSLSVGTISYSKQSSVQGSDISLKSQLDGDEISDSSSSYGCGTYHRRESLSRSSLSSYSEDEESYFSSESSRQLSDLSESTSAALPPELENCPSSSLVESRLSDCDLSTDNNLLRLGIEVSKALEEEIDEGNLIVDFSPSIEDDQEMRCSIGHVKGRICGNTKCINGTSDKIEMDQEVDVKVSDLLKNVKRQKILAIDADFLEERRQIRSQSPPTVKSKVLSSCLRETQVGCFADSKDTTRQQKKISTTSVRDVGGELSYSLKTELLANANSNLRSSVTSIASEESIDSQNDDASKKSVGSSRFASMMANLKSSNEAHYNVESKRKDSSTTEDNTGSDDEHIFEAPKIVNERGQSMRSIVSQEMPEISLHFDDFLGGSKSEADEEEEGKRSRFRVRRPSLHQGNDNSSEIITANQKGAISDAPQVEGLDNDNSDDESRHSDASFSSVSSGEDQNAKPVTSIARIRYPDDDENSSDDDLEYYNEPTMTILTPITEMGSMESDVETTSHVSDESGSDCDDIALSQTKDSRLGKHENPNIFQVIKQVRANDPNLKQIKLNDSGLNDFDAAKLLYLLHENSYVTHISLANNKLGDGSAISLAHILIRSKTILFICLRGNNIGNKGALALKKVLRLNDTLSHLDVNDNDIDSYVMEGMQKKSSVVVPSHLLPVCALNNSIAQGNGSDIHLPFVNSEVAPRLDLDSLEVGRSGSGKDKIKVCRLINIFDETCSYDVKNHALFQSKISIAEDPGLKPGYHNEVAFHLAMSLSLFHLDSKWHLKGSSMAEGNSETCLSCLGNNRILPWNKGEDERKASRSLPDTTKLRWQQSASKPPTLRKNLFSLNKKCIIKKKLSCGSHPLYCPPALTEPHQSLGEKMRQWMSSFKRLDPRWQIRSFFNDVTLTYRSEEVAFFSVWRQTSADAIAKMMRGDGVGKGLNIKVATADKGVLSGYVPFLQIHQENHKELIRIIPKEDRTKIFFKSQGSRNRVGTFLGKVSKDLTLRVVQAKFLLARAKFGCDTNAILREELNFTAKSLSYELENPKVELNDDYGPEVYCIEVPCRVLWEGLVEGRDLSRNPGSNFDSCQYSRPIFQDMNFAALRQQNTDEPLPVLYQTSEDDPFDASMLVMAYEEDGKVAPVVSNFDCLLIASKKISYVEKMVPEQVDLMYWYVSQIEWILENHKRPESWATRWLEILKHAASDGFYPSMPRLGFGDPISCSLVEACAQSAKTGVVRHGPDCFNFSFPQLPGDKFLIIFPGKQIWRYVDKKELMSILHRKIQEGFTFPLNPTWILCDPEWMSLFQDLVRSRHYCVQSSIDLWFPQSGIREKILAISQRFPKGFFQSEQAPNQSLAEFEYERFLVSLRARGKMRRYWRNLRQCASSCVDDNCISTVDKFQLGREKILESSDIDDEILKEICKPDFFHTYRKKLSSTY